MENQNWKQGLRAETIPVFETVSQMEIVKGLYLCGGTAQSLQMMHRKSEDLDFELWISIEHNEKHYQYAVRYADFCYAVAKACTEVLKKHGFTGYHRATYTQDINIRQLLFLKGIALGDLDACKLRYYEEDAGETSDLSKELELLLFDM